MIIGFVFDRIFTEFLSRNSCRFVLGLAVPQHIGIPEVGPDSNVSGMLCCRYSKNEMRCVGQGRLFILTCCCNRFHRGCVESKGDVQRSYHQATSSCPVVRKNNAHSELYRLRSARRSFRGWLQRRSSHWLILLRDHRWVAKKGFFAEFLYIFFV